MPDIRYGRITPKVMARKALAYTGAAIRLVCCECGRSFNRSGRNLSGVRCPRCHSEDVDLVR